MGSEGLVQIGERRGLEEGHSARPNNRAPFARYSVLFTSGKGGVGKSTVAVNTAVALAQQGLRVGILDADVYGPSVPRLLMLHEERLQWGEGDQMIPAENFGVKAMSVGFTTPESDTPLAWRSSVATSAIVQLIEDTAWGALDVLIIDAPPGTGDVQLTMVQELRLSGAVVVTTPQLVATDDVRRALRMLREVQVPVLGVVENMSYFLAPDTQTLYRPFGEGGGARLAEEYGVPLLGALPLSSVVRASGDEGRPVVAGGPELERRAFLELARQIWEGLGGTRSAPAQGGGDGAPLPR